MLLIYNNFIINIFKQNQFKKLCLIILTLTTLIDNIVAQEHEHLLQVHFNPTNEDYFWLENNNYGKYIISNEIEYRWKFNNKKTDYTISVSNAYLQNKKFGFGESFIKHNFSDRTFLRLGKYYRDFSQYLNDDLSSGSMLVSKNAQSMPKIGFVTSQDIKRYKHITFDFGLAHGFFDTNNYYSKAPYLHEKFLYMNITKNDYRISIGFVHEAMWGGSNWWGDLPSTFNDYIKVFIAEDGKNIGGHTNAVGNHLGIWDFYYEKHTNDQLLKFYYQHFFEDTSSLRFINKTDGLWGIELENYIPNTTVLLEYLDTTHCCIDPPYQDDDYYGNYQYLGGWKYENNIIGNPFVNNLPPQELDVWQRNQELTKLLYIGIKGNLLSSYYEVKASRKININDSIKYKILVGKNISNYINFNIFIVNNRTTNGTGIGISYLIRTK